VVGPEDVEPGAQGVAGFAAAEAFVARVASAIVKYNIFSCVAKYRRSLLSTVAFQRHRVGVVATQL
jgi:hypothetical protein